MLGLPPTDDDEQDHGRHLTASQEPFDEDEQHSSHDEAVKRRKLQSLAIDWSHRPGGLNHTHSVKD